MAPTSPAQCNTARTTGSRSLLGLVALCAVTATMLWPPAVAAAQNPGPSEYQLKTVYLYKFLLYSDWPAAAFAKPNSPCVIGILGDDPFGNTLDALADLKTINGRKIVIKRFQTWDDYKPCHVLFVARTTDPKLRTTALDRTKSSPLLLVGETPGFASRGAPVNFYRDIRNRTIGFAARSISSRSTR